ncbi:MAG: PAS domain-containing protein [Bacteroides sp.]|nr:PAS domain-containing protein [Bacteroides sp.]
MYDYFKSIIDNDKNAVVICNLKHEIIYMNPAAVKRYEKRGGERLLGASLLNCHSPASIKHIERSILWFHEGPENNIVYTAYNEKQNIDIYMVALRDGAGNLIGYYEKHECRSRETEKPYYYGNKHTDSAPLR